MVELRRRTAESARAALSGEVPADLANEDVAA
jgi:hypothetical protein